MKFYILTFGCRVNQADSLSIGRALVAGGCDPSPLREADVVVVNTCSVTSAAEQDARQAIRRLARERPARRIIVTGCYAKRNAGEIAGLPGVHRVVDVEDAIAACCEHNARDKDLNAGMLERRPPDRAAVATLRPGFLGRTV
ncbi:MAG: hypothetical protein EHM24_31890, partial [Acidobacteria bacterium]